MKEKRQRKLSRKYVLIHDNVRPHVTSLITNLLASFKWDVFPTSTVFTRSGSFRFSLVSRNQARSGRMAVCNWGWITCCYCRGIVKKGGKLVPCWDDKLVYRYNKNYSIAETNEKFSKEYTAFCPIFLCFLIFWVRRPGQLLLEQLWYIFFILIRAVGETNSDL